MTNTVLKLRGTATFVCLIAASALGVDGQPWVHGHFRGRIAYSCDGNHNDPDDWIASPVTLAILAEAGLKDRLVHFDYNSILHETNPKWEKINAASVVGAVERYGFDKTLFYDCRKELEAAVASIARAIDKSSADTRFTSSSPGRSRFPISAFRSPIRPSDRLSIAFRTAGGMTGLRQITNSDSPNGA